MFWSSPLHVELVIFKPLTSLCSKHAEFKVAQPAQVVDEQNNLIGPVVLEVDKRAVLVFGIGERMPPTKLDGDPSLSVLLPGSLWMPMPISTSSALRWLSSAFDPGTLSSQLSICSQNDFELTYWQCSRPAPRVTELSATYCATA